MHPSQPTLPERTLCRATFPAAIDDREPSPYLFCYYPSPLIVLYPPTHLPLSFPRPSCNHIRDPLTRGSARISSYALETSGQLTANPLAEFWFIEFFWTAVAGHRAIIQNMVAMSASARMRTTHNNIGQ